MSKAENSNRIVFHPVLGEDARRATVRILFDGRPLSALSGESIASALWADRVVINRTMPESGSPRGMFCGVGRCPDCMMTVDGELNVRTCVTPVSDGMVVETQQGLGTWKAHA